MSAVGLTMAVLLLCMSALPVVKPSSADLEDLIAKMEADAIEFAQHVEALYEERCTTALENCASMNYETCLSALPNQQCITSDEIFIEECNECGALFDNTTSTVSLPREIANGDDFNPTDEKVIESICYSRRLDDWFRDKRAEDAASWQKLGVESPQMFYGASDGTFRIFPGRRTRTCGVFDPRVRPWYIAASSGPKNVVLVLDTSGSMSDKLLDLLKEAATRIIDTLTVADRVAIVRFDSDVQAITDEGNRMFIATEQNKAKLTEKINGFKADGGTNFYDAFDAAFDIMDTLIDNERNVECNSAILFFTDGKMTKPDGKNESDVINLVTTRLQGTTNNIGLPVVLFTYSISTSEVDVHAFPKQLACSTEFGVWSKIDDENKLVESLASYYTLFALGLSGDQNDDFVAWVEPYVHATGALLGTTVSAPVYDRSRKPPLLVGVVGVDFTLAAMDKVLGVEAGSNQTLERVILASTARCPVLNLTLCELESFRRQGLAGDDAMCDVGNCTVNDFVAVEPEKCQSVSDYPQNLWTNIDNQGKQYGELVCCMSGEGAPSEECLVSDASNATISIGVIIGSAVGGVIAIGAAIGIWWIRCRPKKPTGEKPEIHVSGGSPPEEASPGPAEHPSPIYPIPPPQNPSYHGGVTAPSDHLDEGTGNTQEVGNP